MPFTWIRTKVRRARRPRRRTNAQVHHYEAHKEEARVLVHERLTHWNQFYGHTYKRVAIRNQRSRWGSCSSNQNLNFNYRIMFLPDALIDYIIVHELCHLIEMNHSDAFWVHVEKTLPDYKERMKQLRSIALKTATRHRHPDAVSLSQEESDMMEHI